MAKDRAGGREAIAVTEKYETSRITRYSFRQFGAPRVRGFAEIRVDLEHLAFVSICSITLCSTKALLDRL